MALYKSHSITLDTKRTPKIALQNIVVGETGNKLTVTLKNDGSTVSLNGTDYRVCLRVDSAKGVVRQDSSLPNSGITFSSGKAIIMLSRDSFAASLNRCRLEIFSTETDTDDILICSSEFQFTAASNDTGENAGEVYPSLILAEQEAREATQDANDAATAANDAADAANAAAADLNELLDNIDTTPTENSENLVTSGGVYAAIPKAATNNPVMDGTAAVGTSAKYAKEDHVHPSDTSKQNVLTFDDVPTSGSNNPVKSGGIHTALAGKQDVLTFDDTPTIGSNNPVKSGGTYTALDGKAGFLGYISSIGSAPSVSLYRIGDYFLYFGSDDTLPTSQYVNEPVKQGDIFVCTSVEGYSTNHSPIANPTWSDFRVIPGTAHKIIPSDGDPVMDGAIASAGTSKKYSRADHVHPSDTSKLNVSSAPMVLRLEPNWQGGTTTDQFYLYGATIAEIVAAHTWSAPRPIMACVQDPYGGYVWIVESTFSFNNNIVYISLSSTDKDSSNIWGYLAIDTSTNTFTTNTQLVYYEV
jgi:hypothetical protein